MVSPPVFGAVMVMGLLFLICLRIPIAIALMVTAVVGLLYIGDTSIMLTALKTIPYSKVANWSLLPVPLFILMGHLSFAAGISKNAYRTASTWLSWLPGGLGVATMGACGLFAACAGSSVATAGTMGRIALPEMLEAGYEKKFATGTVASGALVGIMIPPSVIFVLYGIVTETSIADLLLAGIVPGLLTLLIFSFFIIIKARINPKLAPSGQKTTWREKVISTRLIWGILILAGIIMGGIYSGAFTPSEAAGIGAFVALLFGLFQGRKALPNILEAFRETVSVSSMLFFLVIGASIFSFTLTIAGIPSWFAETIVAWSVPRIVVLVLIIAIYFILGMFVDTISMMLVTLPVIFPVIGALGYDPIWFGVLLVKFNELGMITPPVGINVYVIKAVSPETISLEDVFRGTMPFLVLEFLTIAILIAFPKISLWLPMVMSN